MSDNPFSAPNASGKPGPGMAIGTQSLPGMALAIAIIGLIIGALNFFGSCCGIAGVAGFSAMANSSVMQEAMDEAAKNDPNAAADFNRAKEQIAGNVVPLMIQLGLGLILGVMLLGGGIGTLMKKEWGRNLLVIACLSGIAISIIGLGISFATGNFGGNAPNADAGEAAIAMGGMVVGLLFTALYIAYYIWGWRYLSADERRGYFS